MAIIGEKGSGKSILRRFFNEEIFSGNRVYNVSYDVTRWQEYDMISHLAKGGFIIILDRPFQVGDKIQIDNYYGEVPEIGLRSTRIVTPDDLLVSLPNADIVNNAVSHSNSGALDCQVVTSIFLPALVDIDMVKAIAYSCGSGEPGF